MNTKRVALLGLIVVLLSIYNGAQPELAAMRQNDTLLPNTKKKERYGPSMEWLDRLMKGNSGSAEFPAETKLDFNILSSMMIAGLASGFKSQVANLLWMKADEYWHKGMSDRQVALMEAVVTLDPQFVDAWSTAGWHWAYNIYADEPERADIKHDEAAVRRAQLRDLNVGMDYLKRGANMNPDTYRLWFEYGWTRSSKAGKLDDEAVTLFRTARRAPDARDLEQVTKNANGVESKKMTQGADLIGRTIGHIYEKRPDIDKALREYSIILENGRYEATTKKRASSDSQKTLSPRDELLMQDCGKYWGLYGSDYAQIVTLYRDPEPVLRKKIRQLIPDIGRMVAAQATRERMQQYDPQPTGAFISIVARYMPTWIKVKNGDLDGAIENIIGVMNADPKYHLQKLAVTAKIFELRGDSPEVIAKELSASQMFERTSSQEIGLHLLANLYEMKAAKTMDASQKKAYLRLSYDSWYRARVRNSLDYYALIKTYEMEGQYHFIPSKKIIDAIEKTRTKGNTNAAPEAPPNVSQYQSG